MRRGRSKAKAGVPAPEYETGIAVADAGPSQSDDCKSEPLALSEASQLPVCDTLLQIGVEQSTCVEQFGEPTADGQSINDAGNDHGTPTNVHDNAAHQPTVPHDIKDEVIMCAAHVVNNCNNISNDGQRSPGYAKVDTKNARSLLLNNSLSAPDADLKTVSVVGAMPQDITNIIRIDKKRTDASWVSLITTSSWSNGNKHIQSPSDPVLEVGPIPYKTIAKLQPVSSCDYGSIFTLPAVIVREPQIRTTESDVEPILPPPSPPKLGDIEGSDEQVCVAAPAHHKAEETSNTAFFDRWAEVEGAWNDDKDVDENPTLEVAATFATTSNETLTQEVASNDATTTIPLLQLALQDVPLDPDLHTLPTTPETDRGNPLPALDTTVMSEPPISPLTSISETSSLEQQLPISPSAPPMVGPVVGTVEVPLEIPLPLPDGRRLVRTLLFDEGPVFSAHPVQVTVIVEPKLQLSGQPADKVTEPIVATISTLLAEPSSQAPAFAPPNGMRLASSTVPTRSNSGPASPSLFTAVVGLGVSFGKAVSSIIGFGGKPPSAPAGVRSRPAAGQGTGAKSRSTGIQRRRRR